MPPLNPTTRSVALDSGSHARLAIAVCTRLGGAAAVAPASRALDGMAAELSTAIDAGEDAQLAAASRIAVARFTPVPGSTNLDELLLDRVLRSGRGHPLVLAIVLAEAGRRAGLPLGVLRQGERSLVGHGLVSQPRVIDLDACGVLRDVAGAESTLRWIGPGETGSALAQLLDTAARAAEADRLLAVLSALRGPAGVG